MEIKKLTLFGKVLIIKSPGLSQLVHSVSNINVPTACFTATSKKLFSFLWNNKRDRIKIDCLYQGYKMGGIRMSDVDLMKKALRRAWLPRLLNSAKQKWKSIPDYFFRKRGGLNFLLRRSYHYHI